MTDRDLPTMFDDLTAGAPPSSVDPARAAADGRAVVRRRWYALGSGLGVIGAVALASAVVIGTSSSSDPIVAGPASPSAPVSSSAPSVSAPAVTTPAPDPGGVMLPVGFPIGSAVDAVASALPAGVAVGELPMDIAWRPGGTLTLPLATDEGPASLVVTIDTTCAASSAALTPAQLDVVTSSVCAAWADAGSPPIVAIEPGAVPEERPDLAAS